MSPVESVVFWIATPLLAVSFASSLLSVIFGKRSGHRIALFASLASTLLLTLFGILRWVATDHPPFVTLFESMTNAVWFLLVIFHIMYAVRRQLSILLLPVSFFGFLLLGWASSMQTAFTPLSATLETVWLFIHASFATSGAAVFVIASSLSILYLLGRERLAGMERIATRIPDHSALPRMILNFVIFGLILWGVMIVSGAIWANAAWGRYWAWDPIELWSLISWLFYGVVLHARIGLGISHRLFCRLTILASLAIIFALWGVSYVYETIHTYG